MTTSGSHWLFVGKAMPAQRRPTSWMANEDVLGAEVAQKYEPSARQAA